MTALHRNDSCC